MKINELIQDFVIQTSTEEKTMLNKLKEIKDIENFMEREQEVIRNPINKSLVRPQNVTIKQWWLLMDPQKTIQKIKKVHRQAG